MISDSIFFKNGAGVQTQGWTLLFLKNNLNASPIFIFQEIFMCYVFNLKLVMSKQTNSNYRPGVVVHTCNASTQEAEA